ncbi:MAG: hypothetical protein M9924_19305 [Rhizobiaceae bacterium]|nr:hypothetical protein [Rhizobiaceae bacterium]
MKHIPPPAIVFLSSNGIGLGHLTRQMAVASRLAPGSRSIFATMSYAASLASAAGYPTLFLPHHRANGTDVDDWNLQLEFELDALIRHAGATTLVFDATAVFGGVLAAMNRHEGVRSVWLRRAMWSELNRKFVEQSDCFDLVVEPGELADEFDEGPTKALQSSVARVPPVLLVDPGARLDRDSARRELGLPGDAVVVAMQLGSGMNFDMNPVRQAALRSLAARPDVVLVELRSPVQARAEPLEGTSGRHVVRSVFPAFRYSRAFDAAICAPGYNSFHENVLGAIPSLFVPNEAEEMDRQIDRARWAEREGLGLLMRRDDHARIDGHLDRLLDAGERSRMTENCGKIGWHNGADDIARMLDSGATNGIHHESV